LFQLYVDDFVKSGHPDTSLDASRPTETPEVANLHTPVVAESMKMEMEDLRQQLQLLKKQAMTALDQARKSSEREQAALLQAQDSANLEKAATLEATRATERENYMIELMTDASQDMAGTLPLQIL
jgi:multidrug efflux pump subunit AcrA (membrane-fusion protein)